MKIHWKRHKHKYVSDLGTIINREDGWHFYSNITSNIPLPIQIGPFSKLEGAKQAAYAWIKGILSGLKASRNAVNRIVSVGDVGQTVSQSRLQLHGRETIQQLIDKVQKGKLA